VSDAAQFAVIGHPIAHSRSPQIHAAFAAQFGIVLEYRRIDVPAERLAAEVRAFFAAGGRGLNVTLPHKSAVLGVCEVVAARAQAAGAANTISPGARGLVGDNTDGIGLVRDLERVAARFGHNLYDQSVLIIGSGGAARGVVAGLLDASVKSITLVARDAQKARSIAEHFAPEHAIEVLDAKTSERAFDIVINATSAGLSNASPSVGRDHAGQAWLAYDLGYQQSAWQPTPFLAEWGSRGVQVTADGLGMLVEQAAEAFFLWHGVRPDVTSVIDALREAHL